MKQRFKNLGTIAVVLAATSCLKPLKRNVTVDLGPKPRVEELSANRIFEKRQGLFATVSQNLIDYITSQLLLEFREKRIDGEKGKIKKEPLPYGRLEHQIGGFTVELCTTDLKLSFSEKTPSQAELDFEFCSIDMTVENAVAKIYPNALPDKPLALSVRKLDLKDKLVDRKLKVTANVAFGFDGEIFLSDMELISGLEELTDPSNYNMDLSYSGFENSAGSAGDEVNRWRKDLLIGILKGIQGYSVAALKNSITRVTRKTLTKIDKKRTVRGDTGFNFKLGPFDVTGSYRLSGLVGGSEGLGVAAEILTSVRAANELMNCSPMHETSVDPAVTDLNSYHKFFKFPERINRFDVSSLKNVRTGLYLSKEFINNLLWQPFGSQGSCEFYIPLPNGINSTLTIKYEAPIFVDFDSALKNFGDEDGVAVTVQMPAMTLVLSKELTRELVGRGIEFKVDGLGRAEISVSDFPYTFELLADNGDVATVIHPFIRPIYSDRYSNPAAPTVERIADFISDTVPNYSLPGRYEEKVNALLQSLFDQILVYTTWKNLLAIKADSSEFVVSGFEFDREAIIAKVSGTITREVEFDLLGSAEHVSSGFDSGDEREVNGIGLAEVQKLTEEVDVKELRLPNLLGSSREAAVNAFSAPEFLPENWLCKVSEIDRGFPGVGDAHVFVSYAVCGPEGEVRVEYRWHHQVIFGEGKQEYEPVSYVKLRNLYPGQHSGPGLSAQNWLDIWNDPFEQLSSEHDLKLKWISSDYTRYLRGLCRSEENCSSNPGGAHVGEVELWRK